MAEGLLRKIAAEAIAEESEELAVAGVELALEGAEELAVADELDAAPQVEFACSLVESLPHLPLAGESEGMVTYNSARLAPSGPELP